VIQGQTPAQGEHSKIGSGSPLPGELDDPPTSESVTLSFGPFRLFPGARAFEKDGVPVALGNRALDILMVLVERAGEVVSQRELIARVWRGLVVDPGNLRVHMAGLRKALGEHRGERYIANVTGQGYCFVAPVSRETAAGRPTRVAAYPCATARQHLVLPPVLARMVGRDEAVRIITADLIAERFVTIIGPGGMGKTTVAVCVSHAMLEEFADAVCFVDLGDITDPNLVVTTVASKLGLTIQTDDVLPALLLCLRTLRILLVLDNCEHMIDASATLAERIYREAHGVHILATSREAMRVEGEHVYWLPPLESPAPDSRLNSADAFKFPATKLFLDRAAASGSRLELSDEDASTVAGICGRLDGIPLAIEFAAARVAAHGITGTADLLKTRLGLHWPGRRTALPRHQTLHALLDWSYSFLTESERLVLRRLAIFVGLFALEAAKSIACDDELAETQVVCALDSLVAKSLITTVAASESPRYRLLETTRVYAMEKLEESREKPMTARRHAQYFASLLGRGEISISHGARSLAPHLGNVRAALEWVFSDGGTGGGAHANGSTAMLARAPDLAINLTVGCVPIFLELSLLSECHRWSTAALRLLDGPMRGSRQEMVFQEAVAVSSTWTRGNGDDVRAAIMRALEIAHSREDTGARLRLLAGLHMFLLRVADIRGSLAVAEEFANAARAAPDASYGGIADWLLGCSHHFLGKHAIAREHLQRGLARSGPLKAQLFGLNYKLRALIVYQRVLWLSGFPGRALELAREALSEAEATSKPVNICFACLYTAPVFLWCGELDAAREVLERLMTHPNWHALPSLHATAFVLKGELLLRQGDSERGLGLLKSAPSMMRADRQTIQLARANCALAEGLAAAGQLNEALTVIDGAIAETAAGSEAAQFPELLRVKAHVLLSMPSSDEALVESVTMRALDEARRQGALAWELRAGMTLAQLRLKQGRAREGRELLSSLYARFTEGFETRDLRAARETLAALG
jgi:predicted ATPase/DNA-binding winged helix-turn-helix (wHTH) protein